MAKRLFTIMFGCFMAVSVLGCGGGDDSATLDVDAEEAAKTEAEEEKGMEEAMKEMGGQQ